MYRYYIKNILSSIIALLVLLLAWPIYLLIAVAIKVEDPKGSVLFRQKRIGIYKTTFEIYKFRTMRKDTPHDVPTHLLDADKYITKVGRFLRKHSLDELPQIFNILKLKGKNGYPEMAFVGPRPALWNQYDLIEERDKYGANDVIPGLTGWAQIHGRDELEIPEKARYDGYYVKHINPIMDLRCIFGTVSSVFSGDGVVEGGTGAMKRAEQKKQHIEGKKILILTNHSYMLWQFRRELIQELMKRNTVIISMPYVGHEDDFKAMGLKCIETPIDRRGINAKTDLKLIRRYDKMLKDEMPDLVITYSIKPNIYGGLMCIKHKIPYFVNVQGLGTAFQNPKLAVVVSILYKAALSKAKAVFFENTANAEEFSRRHIVSKKKEVILPGAGINLNFYSYVDYPQNDVFHFLYLGRIMREKGMDELFYAVERLHKEDETFILDLVGFYEDEYEVQVKQLEELGIVKFHGFQSDPRPYYAMADCVVMPSYHEGMSNVNLEAAATGRPVITTDIPGCREAVDQGKTGLLVKKAGKVSLYKAMKRMLQVVRAEREEIGIKARRKMENEFAKDKVVAKTINTLTLYK